MPVDWKAPPLDICTTENIINKDEDNPDDTDESVSALSGYTDDSSVASETEDESGAQPVPQADTPSTSSTALASKTTGGSNSGEPSTAPCNGEN